ncbi:FAD-dependent oxidoreductase [Plantactinospora soyae]|uniref:2-polyprenyl-6-methoxyphenol hydroxylase-like FAD-dependent oxidoreductase n=1 Tax=Plantactinospora soyae TaxID=1544732 RepID=A0A927M4H0_9ACTN|nr:FAD-binding monooxygenase [Plantactinospora soyae]MBE1487549.1 2-polyprenyl-6-methoxyphenol hydroxylase-like FAD-dependent oxidoreductase [Plantactinospora soyae]
MNEHVGDRAVVLGGSVAGLFAARVLADFYRTVTVVDRDQLTGATGPRRAVPQGHHIHGLLARGQQILEELFPGFTKEMADGGVPTRDFGTSLGWHFNGRMIRKVDTDLVCISAGRWLLEERIRARVGELSNVAFLDRTDVVGLEASPDRRRITGARVHRREDQGPGSPQSLPADLVVDATGRGSRTPRWLTELGYPRVDEEQVRMDLTYTTCDFQAPLAVDPIGDDIAVISVATPGNPRGATFARLPDRYSVSLNGILGDRAPTDPEGFLEYVRSLPVPQIFESVSRAEPLTSPVSFHFPNSIRRRYERLARLPEGLLVVGDAACVFNPIYAQGMTVAAIGAIVLREYLVDGAAGAQRYFRELARAIDPPWDMSAGGDLGFPGVVGRRTLKVRLGNAFMPRLQTAATEDPVVSHAFLRVAGLVDRPESLMRPAMISRVLFPTLRRSNGG